MTDEVTRSAHWPTTDPVSAFREPGRPLKAVSAGEIEREFAAALRRLTGADYLIELDRVTFGQGFTAALFDRAEITLRVARAPDSDGA